jgi:acid phosphatase class B
MFATDAIHAARNSRGAGGGASTGASTSARPAGAAKLRIHRASAKTTHPPPAARVERDES